MAKIDISSSSFINKLKRGDRASFEYLYDHYSPNLYGVIRNIVPTTDIADDVLQRSFVKIWRNIEKYDVEKGTFFTWMLNICRNLAIDEYRKAKREREKVIRQKKNIVTKDEDIAVESTEVDDHVMYDLRAAIQNLPNEQQYVIEHLYLGGLTQRELSESDDIPLGTIKSRVRLALQKLKQSLKLFLFWI